ncbi:MAG: LysR family transcriptional regulator [Oligoflexia bacterium]|nr:LysR family transcriptional regulator [Oligoflexia bacterium]
MLNDIELNHLKYFYYTVLEKGVAPAAKRLHVQQPVVSKMLKTLESNLDQALFWKKGRSKCLTNYGQLVFRHCQVVFNEVNKIKQSSADPRELGGILTIGGSEPIINFLCSNIFDKMITSYPKLSFNIYTSTQAQMINMLSEGKLELGCFFYVPHLSKDLEVIKELPFRFHVVVKKGLENQAKIVQSFIGSREIDDNSTHSFPTVELLRKKYPSTRIQFSSNSLTLHKQLVLKGKGVSILPQFMIVKELKNGQLIDLFPNKKFEWNLLIIKRKSDYLSTSAQSFVNQIN